MAACLVSWHGCLLEVMTVAALTGEWAGRVLPNLAVLTAPPGTIQALSKAPAPSTGSLVMASSRCGVGVQLGFPDPTAPGLVDGSRPLLHVPPLPSGTLQWVAWISWLTLF